VDNGKRKQKWLIIGLIALGGLSLLCII